MSSRINIGKMHQGDNHYRYTMPRLLTKIEGRGNGIKTVLVNMEDIAADLQRPVTYPTKYFGNVLGAQSKYDTKNNKAIVNGSHSAPELQRILQEGFIQKFVLCEKCTNPETVLKVTKNSDVTLTCMACGHVTRVDPTEKLCTFIINNPPDGQSEKNAQGNSNTAAGAAASAADGGGAGSSSDEGGHDSSNHNLQGGGGASGNSGSHESGAINPNSADAAYAASVRQKDQDDMGANLRASSGFAEDDWSEDVSKEAVRRRRDAEGLARRVSELAATPGEDDDDDEKSGKKKKKSSATKKKASSKDGSTTTAGKTSDESVTTEPQESPVVLVRRFLREQSGASNAELIKVIQKVQTDFQLREKDLVCLVAEAVLLEVPTEELKNLHKVVDARASVFSKFVGAAGESGTKILFGYLEKFAISNDNDSLKLVPVLLQKLYLQDVLSKDSIIQWRDSKKSRFVNLDQFTKVKDVCKKFFDWIATQEESDEDEEDEDEDEE